MESTVAVQTKGLGVVVPSGQEILNGGDEIVNAEKGIAADAFVG